MAALRSSQHPHRYHQPVTIKRPPSLQPPPLYRMNRGIKTNTALYCEWYDRLISVYSVETLERQGGIKYREDQKERKFFNSHRSIIAPINNSAQQHNTTIETIANVAEERRSRLNQPLHCLAEHSNYIFE